MNRKRFLPYKRLFLTVSMLLIFILSGFVGWEKPAAGQASQSVDAPLAVLRLERGKLIWQPVVKADGWTLTVTGPAGWAHSFAFGADEAPWMALQDSRGQRLADGQYQYELKPIVQAEAAPAGEGGDGRSMALSEALPGAASVQAGSFSIQNGVFVLPSGEVEPNEAQTGNQPVTPLDVVHADDVIATGSLCVGFDCVTDGTENFGFDTIKMKENNLQIYFDDTSATAGFPANDWRIVANDSSSGGANYLAFHDSTGAKVPFKIMAGAPTNALFVSSTGRVGLGTSTPVLNLHIVSGNTPSARLDQDTTSGWPAQVWDVAGNESNFFVRDVTGGSKLPFRIQPGAPTNSLALRADGRVGFGTWLPVYSLEVEKTGEDATLAVSRTDGADGVVMAQSNKVQVGSATNHNLELVVNNSPVMTLDSQGNATLEGVLYEHSDVNVKANFQPIDRGALLDRLERLPITTWSYQDDEPGVRHMGPMAQDFHDAFGLGVDDTHIATLDANGVTLAATQELLARIKAQEVQVEELEAENQALKERLDRLEALVSQATETGVPVVESCAGARYPQHLAR